MKLAILGADADSVQLVRWAVERGGHELAVAFDSDLFAPELVQLEPTVRLRESWETLLLSGTADAVIVGRGGQEVAVGLNLDPAERRADQLRKLVQGAVPLVVVCPACEAIVGFEIEMIRNDTKGVIVPYVPGAAHPAIQQLTAALVLRDGELFGPVERITLERAQRDRSREAVQVRLAHDTTLLRRFIGTIQTISASGPPARVGRDPLGPKPKELPSLAKLNVHFGGDKGQSAQWSIVPTLDADEGTLTVICERIKVVIQMRANGEWLVSYSGDKTSADPQNGISDAEEVFANLNRGIAGDRRYDDSAWLAACRDQEAAEAVDRSLLRGRTIELFNESHTEDQSFKGVMAMGGCLLLVGALVVLCMIVLVESLQLPIRSLLIWRLWPVYLLVPIVVFLLMQFLQLAVKRELPPGREAEREQA